MKQVSLVEQSPYNWDNAPIMEIRHNNVYSSKYKLVDLCCGAGGLSKGFDMTGKFEIILGVDINKPALETFQINNPNVSTILGDIRKITKQQFELALGGSDVDIVVAGVPCQGFSLANSKRNINDERNFLFLEVIRFVNLTNPKIVLIENVSGMKSIGNGHFINDISESLETAGEGYNVKHFILNAADYGVPQNRQRLIFAGVRKDCKIADFPLPIPSHGEGRANKYNTVRDAIGDLPVLEPRTRIEFYTKEPFSEYQRMMRGNNNKLYNHEAPRHPERTINRIKNTLPGEPMYEKYKQRIRLAWDMLSPTQLAGGIRPQFQFGHPEQNRGLTVRERARIQSFPDDYIFVGGVVQGRVQTGNAVPPLLAKAIAESAAIVLRNCESAISL